MEQLVLTYRHPLVYLPFSVKDSQGFFPPFGQNKRRKIAKSEMSIVESQIKHALKQWTTAIKKLKKQEVDFYHYSIVPSLNIIDNLMVELNHNIEFHKRQSQRDRFIMEWQLQLYMDLINKMRNTFPEFTEEPELKETVSKDVIKNDLNYDDCLILFEADPDLFLQEVIDKSMAMATKLSSGSKVVQKLYDLGVIDYLESLPRFKNNKKELAKFIREINNQSFSEDAYRRTLYRIDQEKRNSIF